MQERIRLQAFEARSRTEREPACVWILVHGLHRNKTPKHRKFLEEPRASQRLDHRIPGLLPQLRASGGWHSGVV